MSQGDKVCSQCAMTREQRVMYPDGCPLVLPSLGCPFYDAPRSAERAIKNPQNHDQAQARIAECVREIEMIADSFGYDQTEWLTSDEAVAPRSSERAYFSLRHLQEHLPWTIPYSAEFEASAKQNKLRRVGHDVLHVMKSLGRIAAEVEAADHGRPRKLKYDELAKEAADLVLCALHIARVEEFDLHDAVVRHSEVRNAATIPPEVAPDSATSAHVARTGIAGAKYCPHGWDTRLECGACLRARSDRTGA